MKNTNNALIIIDLQNDFCEGGSLEVGPTTGILPIINKISKIFDKVVATQDWHPLGHVSFATSHAGYSPFDVIDVDGVEQTLWPEHCVQGTEGAAFHDKLDLDPVDTIIRKGTERDMDSYSGFLENDNETETGLKGYLRSLGINKIYLTGLATDVCVLNTALDGVKMGFETYLLEDATLGVDEPAGSVKDALDEMEAAGVNIIKSQQLNL